MGVLISYVAAVIMNAAGLTNPDGSAIIAFESVKSASFFGVPQFQFAKIRSHIDSGYGTNRNRCDDGACG